MAAGAYLPIRPWSANIYTRGTVSLPEKASQTYKVGAPLVFNGGYVEEAGSAPSTVRFIAARDGQNGGSDGTYTTEAWPIGADDLWEASFEDSLAVADNGANYGIVKDGTTGFWYVDDGDTADQVEVIGPLQRPDLGAVGDTKWRGIIKFQTGNIASA